MAGVAAAFAQVLVAVANVLNFGNVRARYSKDDFDVTFDAAARLGFPPGPIDVSDYGAKCINDEIKSVHPEFERGWRSTKAHLKYDPRVAGTEFIRRSERGLNQLDEARVERENAVDLLLDNTRLHDELDKEKKQLVARLREINAKKGQLQDRHTVLEKDAADKDKKVKELEKDNETLQTKVAALETDNAELVTKTVKLEKEKDTSLKLANLNAATSDETSEASANEKFIMAEKFFAEACKLRGEAIAASTNSDHLKKERMKILKLIEEGKPDEADEAIKNMQSALTVAKKRKASNDWEASSSKAPMRKQLALTE